MRTYIVIMIILVAGGTLFDIVHKKSASYFFGNWRHVRNKGTRRVGGGKMLSLAIRTATVEGLASAEFCGIQRRIAHFVTMYGFLAYTVTTAIMVFAYPTPTTPAILPALWTIGALMVCFAGYWFWFSIRVDVAAKGNSPFRMVPADLFVRRQARSFRQRPPTAPALLAGRSPVFDRRDSSGSCRRLYI